MKQRAALTEKAVKAASPKPTAYRLHDARVPGLSLRVLPSGVKSWNVTWARNRDLAIGKFPVVTLEAARVQALAKLAETARDGAPPAVIAAAKPNGGKPLTVRAFAAGDYRAFLIAKKAPNRDTAPARVDEAIASRSEERRVGKECVRTCRSRWSPHH